MGDERPSADAPADAGTMGDVSPGSGAFASVEIAAVAAAVRQNTAELHDSAPRRTYLAAERTYLAWMRTGLGAIGTALAVGRLLPALIGGSHRTYALLGAGYGVLGIFLLTYALVRAQRVRSALQSNSPLPLDTWALTVTTAIGLILAVATILMVLAVP